MILLLLLTSCLNTKFKEKKKGVFAVADVQEVSFPIFSNNDRLYPKILSMDSGYCSVWNSFDTQKLEIECRDKEDNILEDTVFFFDSKDTPYSYLKMIRVGNDSFIAGSSYMNEDNSRVNVLKLFSLSNSGLSIDGSYEGIMLDPTSYWEEYRFLSRNASRILISANYMSGSGVNIEDIEIDFNEIQSNATRKGTKFEKNDFNSYSLSRQCYFESLGLVVLAEKSRNTKQKDCFLRLLKHDKDNNSYEQLFKIKANLGILGNRDDISIDNDDENNVLVATYRSSDSDGENSKILARAFKVSDEGFEPIAEEVEISYSNDYTDENNFKPVVKYIKSLGIYMISYTEGSSFSSYGDMLGRLFIVNSEGIKPVSEYFVIQSRISDIEQDTTSSLDWDEKNKILRMTYQFYKGNKVPYMEIVNIKINSIKEGRYYLEVEVNNNKILSSIEGGRKQNIYFNTVKVDNSSFYLSWLHYNQDYYFSERCFNKDSLIIESKPINSDISGGLYTSHRSLLMNNNLFANSFLYYEKLIGSTLSTKLQIQIQLLVKTGLISMVSKKLHLGPTFDANYDLKFAKKINDSNFNLLLTEVRNNHLETSNFFEIREYSYKKEIDEFSIKEYNVAKFDEYYEDIVSYETMDDLNIISYFKIIDEQNIFKTKLFKRIAPGNYTEIEEFNLIDQSSDNINDLSSCIFNSNIVFFYTNEDASGNSGVYSKIYRKSIDSLELLVEEVEIADNLPGNKGIIGNSHKNNRVEHLRVNNQDYLLYLFQYNTELVLVVYKYENNLLEKVSQTIRVSNIENGLKLNTYLYNPKVLTMSVEENTAKLKIIFNNYARKEDRVPMYLGSVDLIINFLENRIMTTIIPETISTTTTLNKESTEECSYNNESKTSLIAGTAVGGLLLGGVIGYCASKVKGWLGGNKRAVLPATSQETAEDGALPSIYATTEQQVIYENPVYTGSAAKAEDKYTDLDPEHKFYEHSRESEL